MEQQQSTKKRVLIGAGIFLVLLLIIGGLLWFFFGRTPAGDQQNELFPFGAPSQNIEKGDDNSTGGTTGIEGQNANETFTEEPMFRQLATVPVLGMYAVVREELDYIRYIERETGNTYEVSIKDGTARQLTNTTIPRIQLADWAQDGNTVVLRHLEQDALTGQDIIKTRLGRLDLSSASSSGEAGSMVTEVLPDNIIALSVAPDGKNIFYLVKVTNGVSGTIMDLSTRTKRTVFQNSFSEWTPQLLNDGTIILTTKPSGRVEGYSYYFDPKTGVLKRIVREKNGLTTLGNTMGSRVLFGENMTRDAVLGVYNRSGFPADEGMVFFEKTLPLTSLPEKCAWFSDSIHALCGSFITTPSVLLPDLWYQGRLSFSDTFWSIDTDSDELIFIADPKEKIGQEFDVMSPLISVSQNYFVFVNKKDGTLWSMRIPEKEVPASEAGEKPVLTPEELQDAAGSQQ